MRKAHRTNRGQVLIIFVFAIVGLIGITGLAIDGGNIYSDRRHAQNAADTAALAAALTRVRQEKGMYAGTVHPISDCADLTSDCGSKVKLAALDIARTNGYTGDLVDSTVEVYTPPIDGPYSQFSYSYDRTDFVQVIISTNVNTWFARVLGVPQLHNRVEAVAKAKYSPKSSLYGGNSLVALRPTSGGGVNANDCGGTGGGWGGGGGDVYLGGSSGLILNGGGIFVNSDNAACAFKITNTCPTITLNGADIEGIGGQFPGCSSPTMKPASEPYPYPPTEAPVKPIPPSACLGPYLDSTSGLWNPTDGTFHYTEGHYYKLPPDKNTTLEPGVYCVDNLIKTTNSYSFYGHGAFLYVRPGGAFNFQGGTIQLVAPGLDPAYTMSASTKPYAGFLIYVDETNWFATAPNCDITAQSDTKLTGVIYAPHCDVKITGNGDTIGITAQVISYTLDLEGGAILNFTYDGTKMPGQPEEGLLSLSH